MNDHSKSYCSQTEFDNILHGQAALEQMSVFRGLCDSCNQTDFLYRKALFAQYYHVPEAVVDTLLAYPHQQRKPLCWEQGLNPYIFSTLFDYTRYHECNEIYRYLKPTLDFRQLTVLDYGCLVADYGFFLGMLGSKISICDFKEHADFASFRLSRHHIPHTTHYAPISYSEVTDQIDMAIFGEILEHLEDPFNMLEACVNNHVSYIFTSLYPYGDDNYFNLPGHSKEAQKQAPDCLALLRSHFHEIHFIMNRRMWVRK